MHCTRKACCLVGAAALAAWLAAAPVQAQGSYRLVAHQNAHQNSTDDGEETSELRSDISELRSNMNATVNGGYDQGPGCGPGCGCAPACGCGCEQHCGGCDSCGCDTCGGDDCGGGGHGDCGGGTCGCFEPCCHSSGYWASAELLFFRYHRADGVRAGVDPPENVEFDFETTPRITVGWVRDDGLGVRARYWEFDHNAAAFGPGEVGTDIQVDTFTFDFEAFDTFCLNRNWNLELAAGVRYVEFLEVMHDLPPNGEGNETRLNSFSGWGGVASAELRRCIGANGNLWVRARLAILMDDKDIFNDNGGQQVRLLDATVGMTELAFGYDYVMPLCGGAYAFAGVQAEWQNWYNFSSGFEDTANTEDFAGPADVGFGGFGVRAGMAR
jgi:hypothetical protein